MNCFSEVWVPVYRHLADFWRRFGPHWIFKGVRTSINSEKIKEEEKNEVQETGSTNHDF